MRFILLHFKNVKLTRHKKKVNIDKMMLAPAISAKMTAISAASLVVPLVIDEVVTGLMITVACEKFNNIGRCIVKGTKMLANFPQHFSMVLQAKNRRVQLLTTYYAGSTGRMFPEPFPCAMKYCSTACLCPSRRNNFLCLCITLPADCSYDPYGASITHSKCVMQ